jgi:hypothetical protein
MPGKLRAAALNNWDLLVSMDHLEVTVLQLSIALRRLMVVSLLGWKLVSNLLTIYLLTLDILSSTKFHVQSTDHGCIISERSHAADEDSLVNAEKGQHYDDNRADKQEDREITAMSDHTSMTSMEDSQHQRNAEKGQHYDDNGADKHEDREITAMSDHTSMTSMEDSQDQRNAEKGQHYDDNRADKQEDREITAMSDQTSMTSMEDSLDQRNAEKGQHYDDNGADKQENREITAMSDHTSMTSMEDSQDKRNDDLPSETEDISNRTPDLENGKASKANVNVFLSAKSAMTAKKLKV